MQCGICGNKLAIPPQYADKPGRCTICGAVVNQPGTSALDDLVGPAPTTHKPAAKSSKKTAVAAKKGAPEAAGNGEKKKWSWRIPNFKETMLSTGLWALVGCAAFGGGMSVIYGLIRQSTGTSLSFSAGIVEGLTLGVPLGLSIGSTWGFVRKQELQGPGGALTGFVFGAFFSGVYHPIENALVATSDLALWQTALVGAMGVGFLGFVMGFLSEYE